MPDKIKRIKKEMSRNLFALSVSPLALHSATILDNATGIPPLEIIKINE